jgi:thioredoxin-related protein
MLHESFETEPLTGYIKQNFDTIAINVKGDRDIAFNEEISVTEKELSEILKVRATPAILFLNSDNKTVVRVNGYRAPERFRQVLEYVSSKGYEQGTLADYFDKKLAKNIYKLRDSKLFKKETDLSTVKGPLALIFEDGSCFDCNELHEKILSKPEVQKELNAFTVIRLHVGSGSIITDLEGNRATAKSLAQKYDMTYRPGVLLFDQGKLVRRYDSLLFSYHFKEGFRYVSGGHYKTEDYGSYSEKRTEELLSAGIDIDLGH